MNDNDNAANGFNLKDKLIAFCIHVGLSLPVYLVLLAVVRFVWYPDFYYAVLGIAAILVLLFIVDVVLGPLLTFIVYKKHKSSLKFDLSVIVALQLAALVYGVSIIYQERPLYLVYAIDHFEIVLANTEAVDFDTVIYPELKQHLPKIIGTALPDDPEEQQELLFSTLGGGLDIEHLPHLYRPLEKVSGVMQERGVRLKNLSTEVAEQVSSRWPNAVRGDIRVFPLVSPKGDDQLAVWNLKNQTMVGLVDIDPWPAVAHNNN